MSFFSSMDLKGFMKFLSRISLFFIILLFFGMSSFAQKEDKVLETLGIVQDEKGEKISDVLVVVTKDPAGSLVEKLSTSRNGKFTLVLNLNREFTITFSKEGYITKKISVNTKVVNNKEPYFQYPYTLILGKTVSKNYGPEILGKPIVKVFYDQNKREFDFDSLYSAAIKRELASLTADQRQKLIEKLEQKKELANNPAKAKLLEKEFNDLVTQVSVENKLKNGPPATSTPAKPVVAAKPLPLTTAQINQKKEQEEKEKKEKERIEKEKIEKEKIEKARKEKEENDKLIAEEIVRKRQMAKDMEGQFKKIQEQERNKQKAKTADSLAKIANAKPVVVVPKISAGSPSEALSKEIILIKKTTEELIGLESMMQTHNQYHVSYLEKVKEKNDNYETKYNTKNPLTSLLDAMEEIDKDRKRALRQKKL